MTVLDHHLFIYVVLQFAPTLSALWRLTPDIRGHRIDSLGQRPGRLASFHSRTNHGWKHITVCCPTSVSTEDACGPTARVKSAPTPLAQHTAYRFCSNKFPRKCAGHSKGAPWPALGTMSGAQQAGGREELTRESAIDP